MLRMLSVFLGGYLNGRADGRRPPTYWYAQPPQPPIAAPPPVAGQATAASFEGWLEAPERPF